MKHAVVSPPYLLRPVMLGLPLLMAAVVAQAQEALELEAQQITAPREVERPRHRVSDGARPAGGAQPPPPLPPAPPLPVEPTRDG